jgi:hypothetical protein
MVGGVKRDVSDLLRFDALRIQPVDSQSIWKHAANAEKPERFRLFGWTLSRSVNRWAGLSSKRIGAPPLHGEL